MACDKALQDCQCCWKQFLEHNFCAQWKLFISGKESKISTLAFRFGWGWKKPLGYNLLLLLLRIDIIKALGSIANYKLGTVGFTKE